MKIYQGKCTLAALMSMVDHDFKGVIVNAFIINYDLYMVHAWHEVNNNVYDIAWHDKNPIDKKEYYKEYKPKHIYKYTSKNWWLKYKEHNRYGFFEDIFLLNKNENIDKVYTVKEYIRKWGKDAYRQKIESEKEANKIIKEDYAIERHKKNMIETIFRAKGI